MTHNCGVGDDHHVEEVETLTAIIVTVNLRVVVIISCSCLDPK